MRIYYFDVLFWINKLINKKQFKNVEKTTIFVIIFFNFLNRLQILIPRNLPIANSYYYNVINNFGLFKIVVWERRRQCSCRLRRQGQLPAPSLQIRSCRPQKRWIRQ